MKKFIIYGLIAALLAGVLSLAPSTCEDNVQSYSMCDGKFGRVSY